MAVQTRAVQDLTVDLTDHVPRSRTPDLTVIPSQPDLSVIERSPTPELRQAPPEAPARPRERALTPLGPFLVRDAGVGDVVAELTGPQSAGHSCTAFALHVGGLNNRRDADFVTAMRGADVVYADGMSVVLLARLAGARHIERCPTTDLGWVVLTELAATLGRPVRVALLGGPEGLSVRAGQVMADRASVEIVATESGYQSDWQPTLSRLATCGCDVLFVGFGAPEEMKWVHTHRHELPDCRVVTCGGWFGFIAADERRAPLWMQRAGLEWAYRLAQAPHRLAGRYATGALSCLVLASTTLVSRPRGR